MLNIWDKLWSEDKRVVKPIGDLTRFNQLIFQKVSNFVSLKGLKIVELGAGSGQLSYLMLNFGGAQHVTMVDSSEKAILYSKQRWGKWSNNSRASWVHEDLFSHRGEYDLAISVGLLEHFNSVERVKVVQAHAKLAPRVIVVVPAASYWNIRRMRRKDVIHKYGWQEPLTRDELGKIFLQAGLVVVLNERFMPSYGFPGMGVGLVGNFLRNVVDTILPPCFGGLLLCYGVRDNLDGV